MRALRPVLLTVALALPLAALTACGPSKPDDPVLAKGQEVYLANCASCHGVDGEGGTAPRLIGIARTMDVAKQTGIVTNGVTGSRMQAWAGKLTDEEIAAVVRYTREVLK